MLLFMARNYHDALHAANPCAWIDGQDLIATNIAVQVALTKCKYIFKQVDTALCILMKSECSLKTVH